MLVESPNSKELLEKIGNAYLSLNMNSKAKEYFQQAKNISKN